MPMVVLAPLSDAQANVQAKSLFQPIQARLGMVPNMLRAMAHAPAVLQSVIGLTQASRSDLDPKLQELAHLRAVQLDNCDYCLHYHKAQGQRVGLSRAQIEELNQFEQSGAYNELEKDVLRFAEQWTRQGRVTEQVVGRLAKALSPTQLVGLAAIVGLAILTSRFALTFGVTLP
jgi:AhpD family alkylhydroperoxidase